ncbi:MAG: PTS sugar transporter subunit IIA [Robiginitomaculum sp.]|nr:PTS sugar transporter subunit IIA [Robiginitomaculum sp.]
MILKDLLTRDRVMVGLNASGKKQALQLIALHTAKAMNLDQEIVLQALQQREALGSTGVGNGVAIPHARIAEVGSIKGMFLRFDTPVEFDAIDDAKIDLVFVLIAPPDAGAEHLRALAQVSRSLRQADLREKLRQAPDADACRIFLTDRSTRAIDPLHKRIKAG